MLDSRPRGGEFEPHWHHCVVVLEQDLVLVQPRKTCPCLTERLLMGLRESNQTNKRNLTVPLISLKCVIVVFPDHTHFLCLLGNLQQYKLLHNQCHRLCDGCVSTVFINEPRHESSNNVVFVTSRASDWVHAQSDQSLC